MPTTKKPSRETLGAIIAIQTDFVQRVDNLLLQYSETARRGGAGAPFLEAREKGLKKSVKILDDTIADFKGEPRKPNGEAVSNGNGANGEGE